MSDLSLPPAQGEEIQKELTIEEEYQLWRKNCRYMYEFVSETNLLWPSLTIQWFPNYSRDEDDDILINAQLLIGTNTSGQETNYLKIAGTQISDDVKIRANPRINITSKFKNDYEICRARYMPQDPNIISTINGAGEVNLYNAKDSNETSYSSFKPHSDNGYGLSWNPINKGLLLTGADDNLTCVSDTNKDNILLFKSEAATNIVNDTKWHNFNEYLFASVSEDEFTYLFDLRSGDVVSKYHAVGSTGINSLTFSPFSHNILAIGNANSNINLIDLRKLSSNGNSGLLHTMMGHSEGITCMEFSPHQDGILASGSQDRRIIIWDLFKIGEEQLQEDAEDGAPELFMIHAGHTSGVTDLTWCPYRNWTLGSAADDNKVHLWEISSKLSNNHEEEDVEPDYLE
ncbi:unnamed protein product [Candida verbasci]|uniref:Histone-binding protein RBBP4-like N-terminal domain-containing protein n=1 Tax=Candida verbasci TaxID=1227364 RepID=A0A9W4XG65_9ASCO|nr:unnamed protein product [Candida verbasci]